MTATTTPATGHAAIISMLTAQADALVTRARAARNEARLLRELADEPAEADVTPDPILDAHLDGFAYRTETAMYRDRTIAEAVRREARAVMLCMEADRLYSVADELTRPAGFATPKASPAVPSVVLPDVPESEPIPEPRSDLEALEDAPAVSPELVRMIETVLSLENGQVSLREDEPAVVATAANTAVVETPPAPLTPAPAEEESATVEQCADEAAILRALGSDRVNEPALRGRLKVGKPGGMPTATFNAAFSRLRGRNVISKHAGKLFVVS